MVSKKNSTWKPNRESVRQGAAGVIEQAGEHVGPIIPDHGLGGADDTGDASARPRKRRVPRWTRLQTRLDTSTAYLTDRGIEGLVETEKR